MLVQMSVDSLEKQRMMRCVQDGYNWLLSIHLQDYIMIDPVILLNHIFFKENIMVWLKKQCSIDINTCLYEANQNGGSCFDPLFYYYPTDDMTFQNYEHTFIVGGALKVTPVLKKLADNETTIESYFPNGTWVDLNNPSTIIKGNG